MTISGGQKMIAPKKTSYLVLYDVECSMMGHDLYDVVSESAIYK